MKNCFTETISYLDQKYDLPQVWGKWTWNDLEAFVKHQNKFLARKDHIGFFIPWINLKDLIVIINPIRETMVNII